MTLRTILFIIVMLGQVTLVPVVYGQEDKSQRRVAQSSPSPDEDEANALFDQVSVDTCLDQKPQEKSAIKVYVQNVGARIFLRVLKYFYTVKRWCFSARNYVRGAVRPQVQGTQVQGTPVQGAQVQGTKGQRPEK